jgi:hypothetical protein
MISSNSSPRHRRAPNCVGIEAPRCALEPVSISSTPVSGLSLAVIANKNNVIPLSWRAESDESENYVYAIALFN